MDIECKNNLIIYIKSIIKIINENKYNNNNIDLLCYLEKNIYYLQIIPKIEDIILLNHILKEVINNVEEMENKLNIIFK